MFSSEPIRVRDVRAGKRSPLKVTGIMNPVIKGPQMERDVKLFLPIQLKSVTMSDGDVAASASKRSSSPMTDTETGAARILGN